MSFILAGAVKGLGAGMVGQAQAKAEQEKTAEETRRQIALENLRSQNNINETEKQYGHINTNAIASDERSNNNAAKQTERTTVSTIAIDNNRAGNTGKLDEASDKRRFGHDENMARVQSGLRTSEDAASKRLADELDGDNIDQLVVGEDGKYVKIYKDGRMQRTDVVAADKDRYSGSSSGGDGSVLGGLRQGQGPTAAPAAPAAAAPRPAAATAPARPKNKQGKRLYTAAEVQSTMKANNKTENEVHAAMQAAGYAYAGK